MSNAGFNVWTADTVFDEKGLTKKNMEDIFYQLASNDEDFNGSNGDEYRWEETEMNGFENNCDYLVHTLLKDIPDDKVLGYDDVRELLDKFIDGWTYNDSYYDGLDFDFIDRNNVLFVAVAVIYN